MPCHKCNDSGYVQHPAHVSGARLVQCPEGCKPMKPYEPPDRYERYETTADWLEQLDEEVDR